MPKELCYGGLLNISLCNWPAHKAQPTIVYLCMHKMFKGLLQERLHQDLTMMCIFHDIMILWWRGYMHLHLINQLFRIGFHILHNQQSLDTWSRIRRSGRARGLELQGSVILMLPRQSPQTINVTRGKKTASCLETWSYLLHAFRCLLGFKPWNPWLWECHYNIRA